MKSSIPERIGKILILEGFQDAIPYLIAFRFTSFGAVNIDRDLQHFGDVSVWINRELDLHPNISAVMAILLEPSLFQALALEFL